MIVRDVGDVWQIVLQTDHARLSGDFAGSWAECGSRHDALVLAAGRHDDGWAVWERSPLVDSAGAPVNFLDVAVPAHLAFYRAGIAAITDEEPYAGLLVSMHGAGIYRQRYGADPGLVLSRAVEVEDLVDEFVEEQESAYAERMDVTATTDEERWADYHRLQWYDRFSLAFCMRGWDEPGEPFQLGEFSFEPLAPWSARVDPYPFTESPVRFSLRRRLVPKREWTQRAFREAFWQLDVVDTPLELTS